jgi:hypothetical protein
MKETTVKCLAIDTSLDDLFRVSGLSRKDFEAGFTELFDAGLVEIRDGKIFIVGPESLHLLAKSPSP